MEGMNNLFKTFGLLKDILHDLLINHFALVMDETLAVANKDLEVRGFSKDEYLGEVEVR